MDANILETDEATATSRAESLSVVVLSTISQCKFSTSFSLKEISNGLSNSYLC